MFANKVEKVVKEIRTKIPASDDRLFLIGVIAKELFDMKDQFHKLKVDFEDIREKFEKKEDLDRREKDLCNSIELFDRSRDHYNSKCRDLDLREILIIGREVRADKREVKIKSIEHTIAEKLRDIEIREKQIKKWESNSDNINKITMNELKEKEEFLKKMEKDIVDKELEYNNLNHDLQNKKTNLDIREEDLDEREIDLKNREKDIDITISEIEKEKKNIKDEKIVLHKEREYLKWEREELEDKKEMIFKLNG